MSPTRLARTLPVSPAQWHAVITNFLTQLGTPTQVLPPGADPAGAAAQQVAWGTGTDALRCLKEESRDFVPNGVTILAGCPTLDATKAAFHLLQDAKLKVKDKLHTIREFALVCGELKSRDLLLGSFYLDQRTSALADSDTVGVIHNPNYPEKSALAAAPCADEAGLATRVLAYGLAGALSAVATAWLLRRRR